jgi:hypothetical protein
MEPAQGLDFIGRTLKTTGLLLLILSVFALYYFGLYPTLSLLSGGVWSIVNLLFLAKLVRSAIKPGQVDKMTVAGLALIKFPLLYVSGYFLVQAEFFDMRFLLVGFSLPLAVLVLKVVTRALLGSNHNGGNDQNVHEAG